MAARGWGVQPSEFWGMTFPEFFLEAEARRKADPATDYAGGMTQGDVDELREFLENDD